MPFFSKRYFANRWTRLQANYSIGFYQVSGIYCPYNYLVLERKNLIPVQNYYFFPTPKIQFKAEIKLLLSDDRHFVYNHATLIFFVENKIIQYILNEFLFFISDKHFSSYPVHPANLR